MFYIYSTHTPAAADRSRILYSRRDAFFNFFNGRGYSVTVLLDDEDGGDSNILFRSSLTDLVAAVLLSPLTGSPMRKNPLPIAQSSSSHRSTRLGRDGKLTNVVV